MNQDKLLDGVNSKSTQQSLVAPELATLPKKQEIYFWEKWALEPDKQDDDKCKFFEIKEDDISIHEVLREFESKTLGKKLSFSDVPVKKFPSVRRWINQIMASYPERRDENVEDLLNAFRYSLGPRSKEKYKYIVGVLLLKDVLLLIHSKKDRSLAQWKENIHPVNLILHRKNVLRAAIIRNEFGKITFSAFEQSYSWSKGHAQFWGIEPEDVGWDSLGSIMLSVVLPTFEYTIQLPVEPEQMDIMIRDLTISPTGSVNIAKEKGKITKVHAFRRVWEFNEFYDFCITEKEKLIEYRKEFNRLIPDGKYRSAYNYDSSFKDKYRYKDDFDKLYEFYPDGEKAIYAKKHPRYLITFSTKDYPGIKPSERLINKIYAAIFDNRQLEIWHAGGETSNEPLTIGNLDIFNAVEIDSDFAALSRNLLNTIADCSSFKARYILQTYFCALWSIYLKNRHIKSIFEFLNEYIIIRELEHHFKKDVIFDKESYLEFKSADDVDSKSSNFTDKLVSTVRDYIRDGKLIRNCILYGIEDNCRIKPVPKRRLRSDEVSKIERAVNKELAKDKVKSILQPIPVGEDTILAVLLIPIIENGSSQNIITTIGEIINEIA